MLGVREVANALESLVENALQRGKMEGRAEGQAEAVLEVLVTRFGNVPQPIRDRIAQIADLARLRALLRAATTVGSLEAFARELHAIADA